MSQVKKWINGAIRLVKYTKKQKDGTPLLDDKGREVQGFFLSFERRKDKDGNYVGENPFPLVINEGDTLPAERVSRESLDEAVKAGRLSQAAAEAIIKNVAYTISIPPKDEGKTKPAKNGGRNSSEEPNW